MTTSLRNYRFDVRVWNFDIECLDEPDDRSICDVLALDLPSAITKIREQYGRAIEIVGIIDWWDIDFS